MSHDLFISYRRLDSDRVLQLLDSLKKHGLTVWIDKEEIADFAGITRSIREGLSEAKAMLVWFSATYPLSRPCQWELTAAFIAAQQEGDPRKRILIVNPEQSPDHIILPQIKDQEYIIAPTAEDSTGYDAMAERIAQHVTKLDSTLGSLRTIIMPSWFPDQAMGSNRFVGRLREMWDIHRGLWEGQTVIGANGQPPLVRLVGMGGTGKSLLAEEYALRFGAAYPGGVFWLTVLSQVSGSARDSLYRTIAYKLGIDVANKTLDEITFLLGARFTREAKPFLWIVDNVPAGVPVNDLKQWYAPHPLGKTMITTRSLEYNGIGQEVAIDQLDSAAAKELLTKKRLPRDDKELQAVDPILNHLGYLSCIGR